jgi:hypothetical protein
MATTLRQDLFHKYSNGSEAFVETGTYKGEGIEEALKYNFKQLYSIELFQPLYDFCIEKFKNNSNIKIFFGDSSEILEDITKDIDYKITFWLDGHFSGDHTAKGKKVSPIIEELNQIHNHKRNDHVIMIDDLRYVRQGYYEMTIPQIINKLKQINQNYEIVFEHGVENDDILIAYIK